ncbi:MAG: AraC family transcriptional regulator [Micromonosporaceae bacterium]
MLPLADYETLHTRDVDRAREMIGRALAPHTLRVLDHAADFDARQHSAPLGAVTLGYLRYGAEVQIATDRIGSFYLIHIPIRGWIETDNRLSQVQSTPATASVAQPGLPYRMQWRVGAEQLLARFEAGVLHRNLGELLGYIPKQPLRFDLGIDLRTPRMRSWLDTIDLIRRDTERGQPLAASPLALAHLQDLLAIGLLVGARHNHSPLLDSDGVRPALPQHVRAAVDLMRERLADPINVHDLARGVGVATRSLQEGFQKHLGTTPTAYLAQLRLEQAHADLLRADPSTTTVTAIATRWGFTNGSRFAQAHRRAYDETPSQTLRRAAI